MKTTHIITVWLATLVCGVAVIGAEPSLHRQIDELAVAGAKAEAASLTNDAEFVRRVYLDLAGRIPTADEAKAFFADKSNDKRRALIDRLLASPLYAERMATLFNSMLMEQRGENAEWMTFLRSSFARNASWQEMAGDILKPDRTDESKRGAAYFMTARLVKEGAMAAVDVPGLTRDVGRLFAGVDWQCAQCHDHLEISDYRQRDFQGLNMVFANLELARNAKFPDVRERLMTQKKEYMSVFVQQPETTGPIVPGGGEIEIVTYEKDEAYLVPPDRKKRDPGVPRFSPLAALAAGMTDRSNKQFSRNIVNRLWFVLVGKGLVEPLDLHHADNPPTHPELLNKLAEAFVSHNFDLKWLVREIVLTDVYQRSSSASSIESLTSEPSLLVGNERRLGAEQLFASVLTATEQWARFGLTPDSSRAEFEQAFAKSDELKKLWSLFQKSFSNPPKEPELEFAPTVKSALFFMHDETFLAMLKPHDGNLVDRLSRIKQDETMIDELFLAVLSRSPTDEDRADVKAFLTAQPDRTAAISEICWALLASTEFCVQH